MIIEQLLACPIDELGETLSGFIYKIENVCSRYQTNPQLVIPASLFKIQQCLDAIWHVPSEGLETYLQNTGLSAEVDLIEIMASVVGDDITKQWTEYCTTNNEEDRLSQFIGIHSADLKLSLDRICNEIIADTSDKHKFLKMIDSGLI